MTMTQPSLFGDDTPPRKPKHTDDPVATMAATPRGETFEPEKDAKRLTGQLLAVHGVLTDYPFKWYTLHDLRNAAAERTGSAASEASISARLRDLRKPEFGGHCIERRPHPDEPRGTFQYRLNPRPEHHKPVDEDI